ncbi:MAG: DNA polymerase III subunit alpha [Candidatus Aminicenantes bacterium]|nr:DNA polymerase III subunit alpha [Candidatus Aminicenantes bacterium]
MFVPLRIHSVYSRGRGAVTIDEGASWAARGRLRAAGLADIENLHGWAKWKRAAADHGFKPLFGCEIEFGEGRRFVLLAKSGAGYGRLVETLNRRKLDTTEGLLVIFLPQAGEKRSLEEIGLGELAASGADFYVGCDFFNFRAARRLARRHGRPLLWANPLKFIMSADRLVLVRAIAEKIPFPPERDRLAGKIELFGPAQEALAVKWLGAEAKAALARTFEAAEKCEFSFEDVVPPLPADLFAVPLRETVMRRLRERPGLGWRERERAGRELEAVERSGFAPYFLVVYDVVEFARRRGILHNLKGSGASSYLAHLLGISHINPLEFDLYFERFLNSGRDDPPDIDLDFDSRRRDEVLAYVLEKYGGGGKPGSGADGAAPRTGAAFVCSLKNYRARSALYETARAFGLPPEEARGLSKRIPYFAEPETLRRGRPAPGGEEIWRLAADLGGVYFETSLHVGGVILTPAPVDRYLPLEKSAKGLVMSHYDRDAVEDLKLIKLDLLSVRGLAAVSQAKTSLGLRGIPAHDPKAAALLRSARTVGCFQVESPAMMNLLRRMKPGDVRDLVQALALIRPGPTESGMKEALLRSREGRAVRRDPFLERLLPETDGLLLYEEQVMQLAERAAGMPPGEGDLLRRGLKRRGGPDPALKERFFGEARGRGYAAEEVEKLWSVMEKFSSYSFNKAHSASYAAMAYQAVYLKAHHPAAYMVAVLNAGGGYYEPAAYVEEAKRLGIPFFGPDANRSRCEFEVEGDGIRVGFLAIKGLALRTAERIVDERRNGDFQSLEDFLGRIKPGRAELLSLIRAGVFDSLEPKRSHQVLRFFHGLGEVGDVSDLEAREKQRLLYESLGFLPRGEPLDLYDGRRPPLRIGDLGRYAGREVELMVRVVDARQKATVGGARRYFYLFEDETGLLEGVGISACPIGGSPPACRVRGEVRVSNGGPPKMVACRFAGGRRFRADAGAEIL